MSSLSLKLHTEEVNRHSIYSVQSLTEALLHSFRAKKIKSNVHVNKGTPHIPIRVEGYPLDSLFFKLRQKTFVNNHTDSCQEKEW